MVSSDSKGAPFRIAVLHDWSERPRPNAFGEDMRRDQIRLDVIELLAKLMSEHNGILAEPVSVEALSAAEQAARSTNFDGTVNLAYGEHGRFHLATTPGLLDRLGLPNFGANPLQMLLARNKQHTKLVAKAVGLPTVPSLFVDNPTRHLLEHFSSALLPAIIKPNEAAAGLGMENAVYRERAEVVKRGAELLDAYPEGIMVEHFIPGQDVTVAALSDQQETRTFAYVQRNKDASRLPDDYMNAFKENMEAFEQGARTWHRLSKFASNAIEDDACKLSRNLVSELRVTGYTRADYRLNEDGELYFLELNGQAGMGLGSSIVLKIGSDYFNDEFGFFREFATMAVRYLQTIVELRSSEGEERWSYQRH